jgi:hypothetical protein
MDRYKIAIIDGDNQDIGLKILFPEADYYVDHIDPNKAESMRHYSIVASTDWSPATINDKNYDYLFIIISLYDTKPDTRFYKEYICNILQREKTIISNNNFKRVCVFDNYDYDYDPNSILDDENILFFKRNYNGVIKYKKNVRSFPFVMFGDKSVIEKLEHSDAGSGSGFGDNRVFFSGTLFEHNDTQINYHRSRKNTYRDIQDLIYNPGILPYDLYLKEISSSKFALDLNGVGDPNKRTFEILSQGTLMISEYNTLRWPFNDTFPTETIFKTATEFRSKINELMEDEQLYYRCLNAQQSIYAKYFNRNWLRSYIAAAVTDCGLKSGLEQV